jgi:hypothetical protein
MTYTLGILIFASAWCFGISVLFHSGMILEKVGMWLDENLPLNINKPFWSCPICMASLHGSAIYAIFMMPIYEIWFLIPFCVCLAGFNYVLINLFKD